MDSSLRNKENDPVFTIVATDPLSPTHTEKQPLLIKQKNAFKLSSPLAQQSSDNHLEFDSTTRKKTKLSRTHLSKPPKLADQLGLETDNQLELTNYIIDSPYQEADPNHVASQIVKDFNRDITKSAFTTSLWRGVALQPGEIMLGRRNQKAELALPHHNLNIARSMTFSFSEETSQIGLFKQDDKFYGAYGSYVLNVPVGNYALGMSFNKPIIYGPGPHVIHDKNFKFDPKKDFVQQNATYIKHQDIHIIQVESGYIAKIMDARQPYLLQSKKVPYVIRSTQFAFDSEKDIVSASETLIQHGAYKRVMPRTGTVAVSYNDGELEIINPGETKIISSPNHVVTGFLSTAVRTLSFPSEKTKLDRRTENPHSSEEDINSEVFLTKDSVRIGAKLLVTFKITNPKLALTQ